MVDKTNTLEEQLLNGPTKEKRDIKLTPILKKIVSQIKQIFQKTKKKKVSDKKQFTISLVFFSSMLILTVIGFIAIYSKNKEFKEKTKLLAMVDAYDITNLKEFGFSDTDSSILSVQKLIDKHKEYKVQNENYENYIASLQASYTEFLRYFYLPSLNIRKDNFTGELDTDIIGQKYIEKNPYEDTKLHSKWTRFFKYVGKNKEFNTIDRITIDGIQQDENNPELFKIPIQIDFTSNTKRSFLLLLNKLSITSNPENISLINEFVYYLWKSIKEKKADIIKNMQKENPMFSGWTQDKIIGYDLYNWIKNNSSTSLIDEVLLNNLISKIMLCTDDNNEVCYYRFREKYTSLPSLAYTIGVENNPNKKENLKEFFSDINMLMKVNDFSFDRIKSEESLFLNNNIKYKGSMKIILYGMAITAQEIEEISQKLGSICTKDPLSPQLALKNTNERIQALGEINKRLETNKIKQLWELKSVLEEINNDYSKLSNNQKAIKLFEIYRMLRDGDICNI